MSYQLFLLETSNEKEKAVGENVFFENLPYNYEVYAFYYPSAVPNRKLEDKLRDLGDMTGNNLFVNIGSLNDPKYNEIANRFNIKNLPVVIVTAISKLASPPDEFLTAYAKIDSKRILNSQDLAIDCIQKLFNLFIEGKISEAVKQAKRDQVKEDISHLMKAIGNALKGLEIGFSIAEGKFELKLKQSGG